MKYYKNIVVLLLGLIFSSQMWASVSAVSNDSIPEYKSLFWKIEHPKYDKPSYLYGTMHVSHKIAYHLNDAFYQALKDVDQVALETNPEDWMGKMLEDSKNAYGSINGGDLYQSFAPELPKKESIKGILQMNHQIANSILYRKNESRINFEEETYLDMFIFQAGSKMGKPVLALEDLEEADHLVKKAASHSYNPARKKSSWLKKKLQKKNVVQVIEEAYRDKDLNLIDSLNREFYDKEYNQYMLYDRNYNMVDAMDTVFQKGTVFIGIGAAHLPGEDGVIDILRNRGYTVTPIEGDLTSKGKKIKSELEDKFFTPKHNLTQKTSDGLISIDLPSPLYEFDFYSQKVALNMDITNGAFFLITRVATHDALVKEPITIDDIEGMLYENIPGKIKSQEKIDFQGYPALKIANETKSGEHQKYLIVETPLELIFMKLAGKKDYASKYEKEYFNSIQIQAPSKNKRQKVSPFYGDFEVEMPSFVVMPNNNEYLSSYGTFEMLGYDPATEGHYFVQAKTYHDLNYFEEDDFEVEYLHKVWYDKMDTSAIWLQSDISNIPTAYSHSFTTGKKPIYLRSIKKGFKYYLLGTIGVDSLESRQFLDSFQEKPYNLSEEKYEERTDTSLHYMVLSSEDVPPPPISYYSRKKQEKDTFGFVNKRATFQTPYKEIMRVNFTKYHSLGALENQDSLWADIDDRQLQTNRHKKKGSKREIFNRKKGTTEKGLPYYSFTIRQKGSSRLVYHYYLIHYGVVYALIYDGSTFDTAPDFQKEFIRTFEPTDTLIGSNIFTSKTDLFFEQIHSKDSLTRELALKAYEEVIFDKKDVPNLIDVIKNYKFEDKELPIKAGLLETLSQIKDPRVMPFIQDLYLKSEYNSIIQLEVLHALASTPSPEHMKAILKLIEQDIPLPSSYNVSRTLTPLRDSMAWKHSKLLYPKLLEYSSIREYKGFIFGLTALLKEEGFIKSKVYRKYKKQWLNEAKIEFKRQKTSELRGKSNETYGVYSDSPNHAMLKHYITLLMPFYKDKEVKELFRKINTMEDDHLRSYLHVNIIKNGHTPDWDYIKKSMKDKKKLHIIYDVFQKYDQLHVLKEIPIQQEDYTASRILSLSSYNKIDSTVLFKKIQILDKERVYDVYFFKVLKKTKNRYYDDGSKEEWGMQYVAYRVDNKEENEPISTQHYSRSNFNNIDAKDTEELEKWEKRVIDEVKYKRRQRVRSSSRYGNDY